MFSQWHRIECGCGDELDHLEAQASAPGGSPWFDGHFPGQPILPGIALIAMAFEAAGKHAAQQGTSILLRSVKRVRFKKPVRPDEQFTLALKREQKDGGISYVFTVLLAGESACTGILNVELLDG